MDRLKISDLRDKGLVVLEYVTGSHMYGTNLPTSDMDYKGVYILPDNIKNDYDYNEEVFSEIKEESEDGKSESTFYELKKFMRLMEKSNPNVLEVFNIPKDCIVYIHPCMKVFLSEGEKNFVTKVCAETFAGYAKDQIKKAQGQNKKQNWEKERFERKTIIDFCHVPWLQGSIPLKEWLDLIKIPIEKIGFSKIDRMPFLYGLYHDQEETGWATGSSLALLEDKNTMLPISNIPKGLMPVTHITFNQMAWSEHCDEYLSYQTWLSERNDARWVDVQTHGQKIDGKNMLHMQRLINMAVDIANKKGIITRRPEAEDLIKIRKGEVSLQELLDTADNKISEMRSLFFSSDLPDKIDHRTTRASYAQILFEFNQGDS